MMFQILEPEYLIIHELNQRDKCSIEDLIVLKEKIEAQIPNLLVDMTRCSIETTAIYFSDYLTIKEDVIYKSETSFERIIKLMDGRINKKVKDSITQFFEETKITESCEL